MCRRQLSASYPDILLASTHTAQLFKSLIWDLDIALHGLEVRHAAASENASLTRQTNPSTC